MKDQKRVPWGDILLFVGVLGVLVWCLVFLPTHFTGWTLFFVIMGVVCLSPFAVILVLSLIASVIIGVGKVLAKIGLIAHDSIEAFGNRMQTRANRYWSRKVDNISRK